MLPDGSNPAKEAAVREDGSSTVTGQYFANFDINDLPCSVFACDVPNEVFTDNDLKMEFEALFSKMNPTNFIYLQNFRRVRVYFESPFDSTQARISLHEYDFRDHSIKIFFAQIESSTSEEASDSLLPPKPEKLFLISPPASPPVGWEPIQESEPVIDYGLISAIASLQPGGSHEIHPGTQSTPSVVVHACEDPETSGQPRMKIKQTRRPGLPS